MVTIGAPKETKPQEHRAGIVPSTVRSVCAAGGRVIVQEGIGLGAGIPDSLYALAGARLVPEAAEVWAESDIVVKVKEPQPWETPLIRPGSWLFAYLHLAPNPSLAQALVERRSSAIAFETVTHTSGCFPLLSPMSEIAGKMAAQRGAWALEKHNGGSGKLAGGAAGVPPACFLVIGAGTVGRAAASVALGMGARVLVADSSRPALVAAAAALPGAETLWLGDSASAQEVIAEYLPFCDVVIGAAYNGGGAAPRMVSRKGLSLLRQGSVLVDVSIDQGGCFETSHPTTHADPVFVVDGIVHYCVANMPGAVPATSTSALASAVSPYLMELVTKGPAALSSVPGFSGGLNIFDGTVPNRAVAESLGMDAAPFPSLPSGWPG